MNRRYTQMLWLYHRLRRISLREWPYRLAAMARALLQYCGLYTAAHVAPADPQRPCGPAWVHAPAIALPDAHLAQVEALMQGRIELLGKSLRFDVYHPQWQRDPLSGNEVTAGFGLFLDFRHLAGGSDIKFLWEFNRHLWWVPLAQAYAATRETRYLHFLGVWLRSWLDECPYPMGPHWSSPVEHGVRLINWSLVWHLSGGWHSPLFDGADGVRLREDWLRSIYQHMRFVIDNYSRYSSADNHLIGEAAGVLIAATTWNYWPQCPQWARRAQATLEQEVDRQFSIDGVNREQSIHYQKFSLEFLLAAALCVRFNGVGFSTAFWQRIDASLGFVAAMLPACGAMPAIGDSDDARVLGLYEAADACPFRTLLSLGGVMRQRGDLLAKAVQCDTQTPWLCRDAARNWARAERRPPQTLGQDFRHGGYVILGNALHTPSETRIVFDTGPLGINGVAGHGHADALALCLSHHGMPLLIDSGTYCYNTEPDWRRYFRGSAAHNTMTVDGLDQADYGGSFLWLSDINTRIEACALSPTLDRVRASHDGYCRLRKPARHMRQLTFDKQIMLLEVEDRLESAAAHEVCIYWHFDPDCSVQILPDQVLAQHGVAGLVLRWSNRSFSVSKVEISDHAAPGWSSTRFLTRRAGTTVVMRGILGNTQGNVTFLQLHHAHQHDLRPPYSRATLAEDLTPAPTVNCSEK